MWTDCHSLPCESQACYTWATPPRMWCPPRLLVVVMLERFLIVWLSLSSLLAYVWPDWFSAPDPFVASKGYLNYLFALTMFAIGWMLPRDEIQQVFRRWPTVLGGTTVQYVSMPLLAFGLGHLFGLSDALFVGIMMVGCVPGAMASNVLTMVARGNVSYSLSLTASATLLSPLVVPLALQWALGERVPFPALQVSWQLCWMVVLPVLCGHLLGRSLPRWEGVARRIGSTIANLTILWIIAVVVALNREKLHQLGTTLLIALLTLNVLGFAAGYSGSLAMRLPSAMRRALTLEVGMQNAGLGSVLALQMFAGREETALPAAMYTFGCMFTGTLLAGIWGLWPPEAEADRV